MLGTIKSSNNTVLNLKNFYFNTSMINEFNIGNKIALCHQNKVSKESDDSKIKESFKDNLISYDVNQNNFKNHFYEIKQNFDQYNSYFFEKAKTQFYNNSSIKKSELKSKIISQNGIDFSIEFLQVDNLSKKPIVIQSYENNNKYETSHDSKSSESMNILFIYFFIFV